jgi:hypothetical protein
MPLSFLGISSKTIMEEKNCPAVSYPVIKSQGAFRLLLLSVKKIVITITKSHAKGARISSCN